MLNDPSQSNVSRRNFLRRSLLVFNFGVTAAALAKPVSTIAHDVVHDENESPRLKEGDDLSRANDSETLTNNFFGHDRNRYTSLTETQLVHALVTLKETAILSLAQNVFHHTMRAFDVNVGNPGTEQFLLDFERDPKATLAKVVLFLPTLEESIVRLLPSILLDDFGYKGKCLKTGICTTLCHALYHSFIPDENNSENHEPENMNIKFQGFHLEAVFLGLYLWHLQRTRGFSSALLSHCAINFNALSVYQVLMKAFPNAYAIEK